MNDATSLERRAALLDVQGSQALIIHAAMFMQILAAQNADNQQLADFYVRRLAPDARKAYDAWLTQKPFENPSADLHPFVPGLYQVRGATEAARARDDAAKRVAESRYAGNLSGQYLANTVLFAVVLFFSAMCGKFEQRRVKWLTVMLAAALFGFAAGRTLLLPTPPASQSTVEGTTQ